MTIVTAPDFNELLHLADLATARLEYEDSSLGDPASEWELNAVQKLRDWVEALENLSPEDENKMALGVLIKNDGLTLTLPTLADQNIESAYTISVEHITPDTAERLNDGATFGITVYDKGNDGWWFYVGSPNTANWAEVPADLLKCLHAARDRKCVWLCLDKDAATVENLGTWEW